MAVFTTRNFARSPWKRSLGTILKSFQKEKPTISPNLLSNSCVTSGSLFWKATQRRQFSDEAIKKLNVIVSKSPHEKVKI